MAAIFDFPGHSCIESIHFSSNVLLDLKNGVIGRKFSDITLESSNLIPTSGLKVAILLFVGVTLNIVKPEQL